MNPALLHRRNGRSLFWISFMTALAIHIGAVALAKNRVPTAKLEDMSHPGDVEVIDTAETAPAFEQSDAPPPLEQIHPDQDSFQEEDHKPLPVRPFRKPRQASLVQGTTTSLRSVKAIVTYAPRPVYPYEARRQRITGSGVALLTLDPTSGNVIDVVMAQSCGNAILDTATFDALRRWRFKPGRSLTVRVPLTYTLMGASY